MSLSDRSLQLFSGGYYCAESVLIAVSEKLEIKSDIIPQIATGFCSGIARSDGMCGAVSGAIMGLGLLNGRTSEKDDIEKNYRLVTELVEAVKKEYSTISCSMLIGCDLGTEEGQKYFEENNMINKCNDVVVKVSEIVEEIIDQNV